MWYINLPYLNSNVQCCGLLSIKQIHVSIAVYQQSRQIFLFLFLLSMVLELPSDYGMKDGIALQIESIHALI